MTKLTKEDIIIHRSGGEAWVSLSEGNRFLGRFKYASKNSAGPFATFLRKNFSKEEVIVIADNYKNDRKAPTPFEVATEKGFLLSHIKKWLKEEGYPQTKEGYNEWRIAKRNRSSL